MCASVMHRRVDVCECDAQRNKVGEEKWGRGEGRGKGTELGCRAHLCVLRDRVELVDLAESELALVAQHELLHTHTHARARTGVLSCSIPTHPL